MKYNEKTTGIDSPLACASNAPHGPPKEKNDVIP